QQPFPRRVLQQTHERFDLRAELDKLRVELRLCGGHAREAVQKTKSAQARKRAGGGSRLEERASWKREIHGWQGRWPEVSGEASAPVLSPKRHIAKKTLALR